MNKFFETLLAVESILVAMITVVTTFGGLWLKKRWGDKGHQKELEHAAFKNAEIIKVLKGILSDFNADRAYVFEFHNGDYFSSGMPMQKFTCTYEVVSDGVSAECQNPGEYRMSNYNDYISSMIHKRDYIVKDIKKMNSDALLKSLLTKKGVKSLYNIPIKTFRGRTIGFIGLDYVKSPRSLSEDEVNCLRAAAKIITGYIAQ